MIYRRLTLLALSTAAWMAAGSSVALPVIWNGYDTVEQVHIWRSGDTLAELLFKQGLGKQKGPLQLYGPHGWIRATDERNKVSDWGSVALGTPVVLILPKVLAAADKPSPKTPLAVQSPAPKPVKVSAAPPARPYPPPAKATMQHLNSTLTDAGPEDERYDHQELALNTLMIGAKRLHGTADRADRVRTMQRQLIWPIGICVLVIITCAFVLLRPKERARRNQQIKLEIYGHISQQDYARTCRQMLLAASMPLEPRLGRQSGAHIASLEHIKIFDQIVYGKAINYESTVPKI